MPESGELKIKSEATKDTVIFSFQDAGVGRTEEFMSKLWSPLFTTKATGMGFGLAICKCIIEAHGGEIKAHSEQGKGSTFTIILPQTPKPIIYGQNIYLSTQKSCRKQLQYFPELNYVKMHNA